MGYDLRRSKKEDDYLTPEEEDVQRALKDYTDDFDLVDEVHDFVPTRILYETYLAFIHQSRRFPDDPETLTLRQFGAALLRVFPNLAETDWTGESSRRRHMVDGRREWGYLGLRGPRSVKVRDDRGRPRIHADPDDPNTAAEV
jgi:hypothetical protein